MMNLSVRNLTNHRLYLYLYPCTRGTNSMTDLIKTKQYDRSSVSCTRGTPQGIQISFQCRMTTKNSHCSHQMLFVGSCGWSCRFFEPRFPTYLEHCTPWIPGSICWEENTCNDLGLGLGLSSTTIRAGSG